MGTDPNEISLTAEEKVRLAKLADNTGASWSDVIATLIDSAEAIFGIKRGLESASRGEALSVGEIHSKLRSRFDLKPK